MLYLSRISFQLFTHFPSLLATGALTSTAASPLDALGNFFKSLNSTSAGATPAQGGSSAGGGEISRNTFGSASQRVLHPGGENSSASGITPHRAPSPYSSSVDETLLPSLHVMVSNLHACVAQSCWAEF